MIYAAVAIVAALCSGFTVYRIMRKKHVKRVSAIESRLEAFLKGEETNVAFSLADDDYAALQNDIAALEEKLVLQRELLEKKSNEAAGFIANVSHQLKTPLAGIRLYCEMDRAPHCEKQLALIEHMERHIKSLLTLEKFRANAYTLSFSQNDLSDIIGNAWEKLRPAYENIRLRVSGNEALRCDGYWLGEAFLNILKNACEALDGAGEIGVSIFREQSSVFVEIEDAGGGIKESELENIFTRFTRLHQSDRPDRSDGTGLGLAITKMITEKHHGTVLACNTPSGLKITFCFPVISGRLTIT